MKSVDNFSVYLAMVLGVLASSPVNAACVVPNQLTNGQAADASQMTENFNAVAACADSSSPVGSEHAVQYKTSAGAFGSVPLSDGQLLIGTSGSAPQANTLSAGPGVVILNSPGNITITATAPSSASGVDWLNESAVVRPVATNFSLQTSTTAPQGAELSATVRGMALLSSSVSDATAMMAETDVPAGHWEATMLAVYSGPISTYGLPGIAVRDMTSNRAVEFGIEGSSDTAFRFTYIRSAGGSGLNSVLSEATLSDLGLPPPSQPLWSRLTYDGTNFSWSFSRDGEVFVTAFSVAANDNLGTISKVGPAEVFRQPTHGTWPSAYHILSWSVTPL